jgi:hypothetical protein
MNTQIDHDKLQRFAAADVAQAVYNQTGHTTGIHDVEIDRLALSNQKKFNLARWSMNQNVAAEDLEAQRDIAAAAKAVKDKKAATQRLEEYAKNAGLADTEANAGLIRKWFERAGQPPSSAGVDACILELNNQLEWRSTEPASEPAPEPKPEVLGELKDGSPQLPIDTPDWKLKQFSTDQLKDLVNRRRAATTGKYIRPSGRFGSSIF